MVWARHSLFCANPLSLELLGASLALFGLLLLGAMAWMWANRRWRQPLPPSKPLPEEEVTRYRDLYDQGVLSKEEFERIRLELEKQVARARARAPEASEASPPQDAFP